MKTNHEKYKWGIIFFDRKDSRVIVPKVNQYLGWTVNFANPLSYIIILGIIAILIFAGRF